MTYSQSDENKIVDAQPWWAAFKDFFLWKSFYVSYTSVMVSL